MWRLSSPTIRKWVKYWLAWTAATADDGCTIEMTDVLTSRHPKTLALLRMNSPQKTFTSDRRLFRLVLN